MFSRTILIIGLVLYSQALGGPQTASEPLVTPAIRSTWQPIPLELAQRTEAAESPIEPIEVAPPALPVQTGQLEQVATVQTIEVDAVHQIYTPIMVLHPSKAKINAYYVLTGKSWASLPDTHFKRFDEYTILVAPPGDYLISMGGSKLIKVIGEGPQPNPNPEPSPNPGPNPQPEPEPKPDPSKFDIEWVIWVREIAEEPQHPDETRTMKDLQVAEYLNSNNLKRFTYDKDQLSGAFKGMVGTHDLPCLLLVSQKGEHHVILPAPKSLQELKTHIGRYNQ